MDNMRRQTGLKSSVRWAIEDKRKFSELIQDLRDLVGDLEGMTTYPETKRLQQAMIRQELASMSDIDTLENIEEARVATFDAVSDAASLRLSELSERRRIQPRIAETASSSAAELTLLDEDDWTVLSEVPEHGLPSGGEPRYQILHTVFCNADQSRCIFPERPSYSNVSNCDDTEWIRLDPAHPAQEEATSHLRGRRRIPNIDAYLKHNDSLLFVVLREYQCCDLSQSQVPPEPVALTESIHMLSDKLCGALQRVLGNKIVAKLLRFEVGTRLSSPYEWFFVAENVGFFVAEHEWLFDDAPQGVENMVKEGDQAGKVLKDFIYSSVGDEYSHVRSLLSRGCIAWEYLNYLFVGFFTHLWSLMLFID